MKYFKKLMAILFLFVVPFFLETGISYSIVQAESEMHGVAIISMDVPLSARIGEK